MHQIALPIEIVRKILGQQRMNGATLYRLTEHCMRLSQQEGALLYHTLTGELLLLSHAEEEELAHLPGPVPPALEGLVGRWFLRPVGADDMALADQVRQIAGHLRKKGIAITDYTIFTTTECNARCYYCFEVGEKKHTMTEQTALTAGKYIAAHCGGGPVKLRWFGGEPLVNVRAIDIITDHLRQHSVAFCSSVTTNGYLFDRALIERAKEHWDLEHVQITLDGTEEVYNRRKAYVHPEGSPFRRVIENISLLIDAGIHVTVRLNMDGDNEKDLYALCDELAERFAGMLDFGVYLAVLYENMGLRPSTRTEEQRRSLAEKVRSLQTYICKKNIMSKERLSRKLTFHHCIADNDSATTITPDGRLGRCEFIPNAELWGSIFTDEADEELLLQWKERRQPEEACGACAIYPQCFRLKKCPGLLESCSPIERAQKEDKLRRAILGAYEDWKSGGQA